MTPTFLYLIEAENGLVKIGSGQYPTDRAATCRTHSPIPTRLIAAWPGSFAEEFELHRRFAADRSHGEWFVVRGALADFVADHFGKGLNRVDTWIEAKHAAAVNAGLRERRRSRSEARKLIAEPERGTHAAAAPVGLSAKQRDCLVYIREFIADYEHSPSYDQIRVALELASKSGVHRLLHKLQERGHVRFLPGRGRSIVLAEPVTEAERGHDLAEAA